MIILAVRWYLRFNLSYRDVEELLVERGVEVDHVTVYRWVGRFIPLLADAWPTRWLDKQLVRPQGRDSSQFCLGVHHGRRCIDTSLPQEGHPREHADAVH